MKFSNKEIKNFQSNQIYQKARNSIIAYNLYHLDKIAFLQKKPRRICMRTLQLMTAHAILPKICKKSKMNSYLNKYHNA
jgi:hypothetical protein